MEVLVTNDDGYDSPGLHAIADRLEAIASVTVVAPQDDQSGVGRLRSEQVTIEERERGMAVSGTPTDAVLVALHALDMRPDLVVAGCNVGGNLGAYTFGRSGTISAAVEAAFFDIPSIAMSLYIPQDQWPLEPELTQFAEAERVIEHLVSAMEHVDVFTDTDYLNVNVPLPADQPAPMRVTRPSRRLEMTADRNGETISLRDESWEMMRSSPHDEPQSTDWGTVLEGNISVTPLRSSHDQIESEAAHDLVDLYDGDEIRARRP